MNKYLKLFTLFSKDNFVQFQGDFMVLFNNNKKIMKLI